MLISNIVTWNCIENEKDPKKSNELIFLLWELVIMENLMIIYRNFKSNVPQVHWHQT